MSEKRKATLTHAEAQELFVGAVAFKMPEKLDGPPIPYLEKMGMEEDALMLYRALLPLSPLYFRQKDKKFIRFGPSDNWIRNDVHFMGEMKENHELIDPSRPIHLTLDEDEMMGAFRVLLLLLHPASEKTMAVSIRNDILWPMAEKLRLTSMLRRKIKIDDRPKERLELDDIKIDSGNGKEKEEEETPVDSESK